MTYKEINDIFSVLFLLPRFISVNGNKQPMAESCQGRYNVERLCQVVQLKSCIHNLARVCFIIDIQHHKHSQIISLSGIKMAVKAKRKAKKTKIIFLKIVIYLR